EVDYFINKNAREFLREQFDLWMYQYVFKGRNVWTEERIRQLQTLKDIAFMVIDFIAQFEDELVRIWNKPKFVRNSHYVLTLDRLFAVIAPEAGEDAPADDLWERILAHPGFDAQMQEWRDLGMVDEAFTPEQITTPDRLGEHLHSRYRYLPLDTRHFPDLEAEIIARFDHLDETLDGWLIHSENYQALNTLLPRFRGQVQCIHIDPPYNTDTSGFLYMNQYRHSSWLTMMENRLSVGNEFLAEDGSLQCHIDEHEYEKLKLWLDELGMGDAGTVVWDKRNPMTARAGIALQHEYILWRSNYARPIYGTNDNIMAILKKVDAVIRKHGGVNESARKEYAKWLNENPNLSGGEKAYRYIDEDGRVYQSVSLRAPEPRTDPKFFQPLLHPITKKPCPVPPNGFSRTPETLQAMLERGEILFGPDEKTQPRQKKYLSKDTYMQVRSVIQNGAKGKADLDVLGLSFPYCHPVSLYQYFIGAAMLNGGNVVLDFFAGSGTTAHAVMNLNREDGGRRKYILVEMGEHFHTVILPRVKKVAFSDQWKDGRAQPDGQGMSHFVKYYALEQYEDTLRRAHYEDADLFENPYEDPWHTYVFLRDRKMLDALEIGEDESVTFHPERLYPDID
ncbi:MAG: site-specific DNA-methyltransferase, partial [Calditrichaeota bacterium]